MPPGNVPVLHNASSILRVTHIEFRILEQMELGLAILTPMAWVEIFRRRLARSGSIPRTMPALRPTCSSVRMVRPLCQSGCRAELPFLFHLHSQSDRSNCLVYISPAVGVGEHAVL